MSFDLDVVLAAHGAGAQSSVNAQIKVLATELENVLIGARVTAAFVRGDPSHFAALRNANRSTRVVIPLLTSDGFYASRLRRDVERTEVQGRTTILTTPVGTHPAFVRAFVDYVTREITARQLDSGDCAIVVVGHGTVHNPESAGATIAITQALASNCRASAYAAFLDQRPTLEETIAAALSASHVIVVPFLIGGGDHVRSDVPSRVAAVAKSASVSNATITNLAALSELPTFTNLVEDIVHEARAERLVLRVGARPSLLSRRQVELFAHHAAAHGVDVRFVPIATLGDRDRSTPIDELNAEDLFTGDIDAALVTGEVDVTVHSLKDLPERQDSQIVSAAMLPRGSTGEVLISRTGAPLRELRAGSTIGVSCARRASQVRGLNPGVVIKPIRGTVPDRVAAVDRGEYDAVVLAAAGLERLGLSERITERFSTLEITPAPGQGAIVVQCRADSTYRTMLAAVDDHATRQAVQAEFSFARNAGGADATISAAVAIAIEQCIELHARLIDSRDGHVLDTLIRGSDPDAVGRAAARQLLSHRSLAVA